MKYIPCTIYIYIYVHIHSIVFYTRVEGKYRAGCLPSQEHKHNYGAGGVGGESELFRFKLCRCAWAARQAQCLACLVQFRPAQRVYCRSRRSWSNPWMDEAHTVPLYNLVTMEQSNESTAYDIRLGLYNPYGRHPWWLTSASWDAVLSPA